MCTRAVSHVYVIDSVTEQVAAIERVCLQTIIIIITIVIDVVVGIGHVPFRAAKIPRRAQYELLSH